MHLKDKIKSIKEKMAQLSPETPLYSNYQALIKDLEAELPKATITLHKDVGDTCESCT
jgi:hypothetical protein